MCDEKFQDKSITIVFCLHELEVLIHSKPSIIQDIYNSNYGYNNFLRDFMLHLLYELYYIPLNGLYRENVDNYIRLKLFNPDLPYIEQLFYSKYRSILNFEITGECDYNIMFGNNKNSLFFLLID